MEYKYYYYYHSKCTIVEISEKKKLLFNHDHVRTTGSFRGRNTIKADRYFGLRIFQQIFLSFVKIV